MRKLTNSCEHLPAVNDYAKGVLKEMKPGRPFPTGFLKVGLLGKDNAVHNAI
jgi:hypothetical protein